jgi:hemolysin activation/secretion protein
MRLRGVPSTPGEISLLNFSACNAAGLLTPWKQRRYAIVCAAIGLSGSGLARTQTVPDAGSVLQQIEKQQHNVLPQKSVPQFEPPPPLTSLGGATVTVTAFRFAGNTLLTVRQLTPAVTRFTGHPIDFAELQNAAIAVATAYRNAGWVVRAYLPQQDVTGGVVTIQIVEAKFGAARVEGQSRHASTARMQRMVEAAQASGKPVKADALDRAILLINDLPGVSATGRLSEGERQAETDLVLSVADAPLVTGTVTADNAGARATGSARIVADASLNGRLGVGDRVDAMLLHTKGSDYQRLAYSLAAGNLGWRVGVNASHLTYNIVTADFAALDAHGTSTNVGLEASYPLLRSRLKNLYFSFNADDKRFDNISAGQTTTDYSVQSGTFNLYGNLFDGVHGGGANSASIALELGHVDLDGSPNEASDALTTRTAGTFKKVRFSVSRLQVMTGRVALYASFSGQAASKNLDSSEKLYLGGAQGVRAYPENEGGGSEGLLMNLEARARLPANFNATGFFDWGTVHFNKNNDFAGAPAHNSDELKGVGICVAWVASFGLNLKATLARRIGRNPEPTSTGDDQDGSLIKNRLWLQASMPF